MLTLQPFIAEDWQKLNEWIKDEKSLVQFGGKIFSYPITRSQIVEYLADAHRFAFKVLVDDNVVGHAEIYRESHEMVKFCRLLIGDVSMRGKGIGQQMMTKLLSIAFVDMGVQKAHLNVFDWNTHAIKCYEKVGFKVTPDIAKHTQVGDEWWTAINMTIDKVSWLRHPQQFG